MEYPEGWLFSFDDHPALKRVTLRTLGDDGAPLRDLKIHQLKEVFIEVERGFTADNWNIFTTNNPNINSLTIKGPGLDTEGLKYIFTNLVELKEFKFDQEYCPTFQNADLRFILQNCRNLKIIDIILHEKPGLHSEVLEEFAEKLKTIKLTIKFDPWSDDDSTDNCADDNSCSPSYFD